MFVRSLFRAAALAAVTLTGGLAVSIATAQIVIPTVPIGNSGNAPDPLTGIGSVLQAYNIGTTEVTNAQYAAFLNAVAATDTNNLYNPEMAGTYGGIIRSGDPGSYRYGTVFGRADNPVNHVSFWDATRFANWLHNGQPTGQQDTRTTEDGAYSLTPLGVLNNAITRNPNWGWAIPDLNEWYKASYHQPASQGGPASGYWFYPTSTDTITTAQANYFNWEASIGDTTPVGSYAANFYGAFDMAGNVFEWTEGRNGEARLLRGGSFASQVTSLAAQGQLVLNPRLEGPDRGFRLVQVPGPSSFALLTISAFWLRRRRQGVEW